MKIQRPGDEVLAYLRTGGSYDDPSIGSPSASPKPNNRLARRTEAARRRRFASPLLEGSGITLTLGEGVVVTLDDYVIPAAKVTL